MRLADKPGFTTPKTKKKISNMCGSPDMTTCFTDPPCALVSLLRGFLKSSASHGGIYISSPTT